MTNRRRKILRREFRGLVILYIVFALTSAVIATQCASSLR